MRFLKSEAGAIILWLAVSLFTAALLTPHLYDAGKNLAESAESKDYPAAIESVARSAERAKPDRYFSRALLISALAILPLLVFRLKRLPSDPQANNYALQKSPWGKRLTHIGSGVFIGAASLGVLAIVLIITGAATLKDIDLSIGKVLTKALMPALGAGVIEELVFRGLLLGLWLRACSPWAAWIGSSLMFAFVHFLSPPPGMVIADPRAWYAGLELLGGALGFYANPRFFFTIFTTLALLGFTLAWCRTRTRSLWFSIGLHTGIVFVLKCFSLTMDLNYGSPLHPWLIGADLKSGILPLAVGVICLLICVAVVRRLTRDEDARSTAKPE